MALNTFGQDITKYGGSIVPTVPVGTPAPKPITPSSLTSTETPITVPQPPAPQDYTGALTAIPTIEQLAQDTTTPAESTQATIRDRILGVMDRLSGKAAAQQKAEQNAGLPAFNQQLTEVNSQIQALQKEALALASYSPDRDPTLEGRGITTGGLLPYNRTHAENIRLNTVKALGLSAVAQTLQGNIALAQQQANRAVEVEFAPFQSQLDYLGKLLEFNQADLTREDRQRATVLQARLADRQSQIDAAKDDRKTTLSFLAEAAKNGAPTTLLAQAQSLDPQSALALLSQYMSDPQAKAQALLDMDYKRQQIAASKASVALDQQNADLNRRKIEADIALTQAQRIKVLSEAAPDNSAATVRVQEALSLAQALRKDGAVGKSSAVGASAAKFVPWGQALGLQGNRAAFEAKVNTLKANLTLDNLKLLKGAMSDKDLLFLNSVGSSLDTSMSEAQFNTELDRIISKLGGATGGPPKGADGAAYGHPGYVSDGTQWVLK